MDKLKRYFKNYYVLNDINGILFWDNATNLPPKSIESRSEQMSILAEYIDKELRDQNIIEEINLNKTKNLNDHDKKNLLLMENIVIKENAVDVELKSKLIKKKLKCEHLWREAREKNDVSLIEKDFDELLLLVHEEANQLSKPLNLSPYDALISNYDRDYNSNKIDSLFEIIKSDIIPQYQNLEKIDNPTISKTNLSKDKIFEKTNQKLKELGFDFDYGRIDQSIHPFCGGANKDVRITTRFENNILETLSALFHETGHGVYEQNRPSDFLYEPIGQARSLSVHESQSLFYENHIFKSKSYFHLFNQIFDGSQEMYKSFIDHYHTVRLNPIRVSADEFSYPIHIFIRYEIEKKIFNNKIQFKDIHNLWNQYYKEYLDIDLPNDTVGVLQDIHWYEGIFGYFPTYAIGAMISSQIKFNCPGYQSFMDHVNIDNIKIVTEWLKSNVHQKASLYSSDEMLQNISGEPLNSSYFLKHLNSRFVQ
jgi:carboxypeptidase Taq